MKNTLSGSEIDLNLFLYYIINNLNGQAHTNFWVIVVFSK